jgi:hypothetical protein
VTPERKSKLAHLASILTAVAAIVAAVLSYMKERPETKAKASYEVLSQKLDALAAEQKKLHEDDVALRGYLDGYLGGMRERTNETTSAVAAVSATISQQHPRPPHVTRIVRPLASARPPAELYLPAPALPEPKAKPEQTAQLPSFEHLPSAK